MKSATIILLALVCSSAFAVPSAPKKSTHKELINKAKDLAFKTALDFKTNNREVKDYIDDLIDVLLKSDWRAIIEATIKSGDNISNLVYNTFNKVESQIGAEAAVFINQNFEVVVGHGLARLFANARENIQWLVDLLNFWGGGEFVPHVVTGYFIQMVFSLEYLISHEFVTALAPGFPEDSRTLRNIFETFDERIIEEGIDFLVNVGRAMNPEPDY